MNRNTRFLIITLSLFIVIAIAGCFGGGGGIDPTLPPMPSYTSPPMPTTSPSDSTGNIEGTVYAADTGGSAYPVENALVAVIDQGVSAYTDANGEFQITGVLPGERLVMVTKGSSKTSGLVVVNAGKTTVIEVEMPSGGDPTPTPSPGTTGTLTIQTEGFYDYGNWVTVDYIRVWEYGNYNKRWYQHWPEEGYENQIGFELNCYNAEKEKYYVCEIAWHNGETAYRDTIYLYQDAQTEYIYHY